LLDRLRAALAGGPPLRLAILFGSRATGHAREGSDIDIGILPVDPQLSLNEELLLASTLSAAVSAEVDVVRLDDDAPLLGAEVARDGICLFEANSGVFAAYRATAMSRWIDFEETIAPHRATFLRRLAEGPPVTNTALVARKLAVLEEHLRRLTSRRPANVATLRGDTLLGCATFDAERLWTEPPQGIASFEGFAQAVAVFLRAQPPGA
jgi:predicted nucleotidyltransferase